MLCIIDSKNLSLSEYLNELDIQKSTKKRKTSYLPIPWVL